MGSDQRFSAIRHVHAEFSRPNNTTVYAARDIVSPSSGTATIGYLTFEHAARHLGDGGRVTDIHITTDKSTTTTSYTLWLYVEPPLQSAIDNEPYLLLYSENHIRIGGGISTDDAVTEGSGSTAAICHLSIGEHDLPVFICRPDSTSLYGILQTDEVFTPNANQKFLVELDIEPD